MHEEKAIRICYNFVQCLKFAFLNPMRHAFYLTFCSLHHPILVFDFSNECSMLDLASFGGGAALEMQSYGQLKSKKLNTVKS